MIILSGALVVLAIALLVTGIVTFNTAHEVFGLDGLKLIYISIGVSVVSALCLAIGVFLRREELFGSDESPRSAKRSAASRSAKAARTAKAKARVGAGDDAPVMVTPATATEVPAGTSVYIVPGRKRYHLETCRQLAGREKEELTFVEAREEGFTACTACLPDTALAARAAFTETETATTESLDTAAGSDTAEPTATDITDTVGDPVDVTRTDLPITRVDVDTDTAPDLTGADFADEHSAGRPAGADVTDEVAGHETPAVFAQSPAPAEPTEIEPSDIEPTDIEARAAKDKTPAADTAHFDEVSDAETASEPAAEERPLARSRSLFEPLDRAETSAAEAEETRAADDAPAAAEEHAADEDAAVASGTAEQPADEDATKDDAVAEADTAEDDEPAKAEDDSASTSEAEDDAGKPAAEEDAAPAETGDAEDATAKDTADDAKGDDAADSDLPYVRILSGTKRYHRPDCALIEDIAEDADDLETLSPAEAKERGCTPCLVCQPDKSPSERF